MTYLSACHELDDLGGGHFRSTAHLRPIAYLDGGVYKPNVLDWVDNGGPGWSHAVARAPLLSYVAPDGMRRLCPTRDRDKYVEIGPPYIKPAGTWTKVNLGTPTRSANLLTWTTTNANIYVAHAGHFVKLEILLKNGWTPPNNQVAFPVGMQGLSRQGTDFYDGSTLVMHMAPPVIYDAANQADVRPVTSALVKVGEQWYILLTLPALTGMAQPVLDPTLTLQPDAASGKDTSILSSAATWNYGIANYITGSALRKGLIEFDFSSIPSNAACQLATLYTYQMASGAAVAWTITVYSIAIGNTVWVEGTKNAAVAGAGEPCWNALAADGAGGVTTAWAGAVGLATVNVDYEAAALGSFSGNQSEANGTEHTVALMPSRVRGWFGVANTNHGMLLVPSAATGGLGSSDHATVGWRPMLVVEWRRPYAPLRRIR